MGEIRDQQVLLYQQPTPGKKRVHWLSQWDPSCGLQGPTKGRMSREETSMSAKKRHKVGHDIMQVHFSSLSKEDIQKYYAVLDCPSTPVQVSANKKKEALSNPDSLSLEEDTGKGEGSPTGSHQVSDYEKLRISNIQRNRALLESLGISGLLHQSTSSRSKPTQDEEEMDSDEAGPAPR
jgi:hypothetical protein